MKNVHLKLTTPIIDGVKKKKNVTWHKVDYVIYMNCILSNGINNKIDLSHKSIHLIWCKK